MKKILCILLLTALIGCVDNPGGPRDPYYSGGYGYDRPYYGGGNYNYGNNHYGNYDQGYNDRKERHRLERERDRYEDERRRLEEERRRRERDDNKYRPVQRPIVRETCPSGFSPSERKCSVEERRRGCQDMRLPGGLGCVKR